MATQSTDPVQIIDARFEVTGDALPRYESAEKNKSLSDHVARLQLRTHCCTVSSGICSARLLLVLHGAVVTRVGNHACQKKFLKVSTKVNCPHSHSREAAELCNGASNKCECIVNASFELPYHATSQKREKAVPFSQGLPSSVAFSGTTFITEQSALSDQYMATTSCQVVYWVTAQHYENSSGQVRNAGPVMASRALDAERLPSTLLMHSCSAFSRPDRSARARHAMNSMMTRLSLGDSLATHLPELSLEMTNTTLQALKLSSDLIADQYKVKLPLTFKFKFLQYNRGSNAASVAVLRHRLRKSGFQDFGELTACWTTRHEYGVETTKVPQRVTKIERGAIATAIDINLPPTYVNAEVDGEVHTAIIELPISLPKSLMRSTTFTSETLKISHALHLEFDSNRLDEASMLLLPKYSTKLEIQCQLI